MRNSLACRYAKALISAAEDQNLRTRVDGEMKTIHDIISQQPELPNLLSRISNIHDAAEATEQYLIQSLDLSNIVANLVRMLTERKRLGILEAIVQTYIDYTEKMAGITPATVTSIRKLSDNEIAQIQSRLNQVTGRTVKVSWKQDPSILGGLRIQIGDRVIDSTLKTHMKQLQDHLMDN
jgi:F-type H+-transporting ATPase subunit delta